MKLTELTATARKKELDNFLTGQGWFRGADVDNLSKEEAKIIAARLVRRIQATVTLSGEETKALETGFADILKYRFVGEAGKTERKTREQTKQELLKVARAHLDEKRVALLQETLAKDYRAEGNEK